MRNKRVFLLLMLLLKKQYEVSVCVIDSGHHIQAQISRAADEVHGFVAMRDVTPKDICAKRDEGS